MLIPLVATRDAPTAGQDLAGRGRAADPSGGGMVPAVPGDPPAAPGPALAPLSPVPPRAVPPTGALPTEGPRTTGPATTPPPTTSPPGAPATTRPAGTPAPPAGADLEVTEVSTVPDQLAEGYVATFRATVRNVGTAASPPGSPDIVFLLDGVPVSWSRSDTSSLRPGEERLYVADGGPVSATWTATRGRYRLVAIVDAGDRIAEPSERNNSATTAFRIR
ncbi:MAG: hypothetical protein AVDCRST_MAG41-4030 [uncultured Corynebacteriales bacterium]|uniref:CARDB domain-containing protein n=1 Tax=uncultured Mycobacteriales bacterium TaxID=581187 RepID=A0A6J4JSN8_9ACTN|nr:MAG: hypothetical protein AVDCRST_MAG41-4030 [uncultured Corynebacteriales bacterium]